MRAGQARSLVIGIGNPLRGDDGIGWRLAARLPARPGLAVRCRQQLTPELAADLAVVDRLLLLDAWVAPGERGEGVWKGGAGATDPSHPLQRPLELQELPAPEALAQAGAAAESWAGAAPWGGASHGLSPQALLALSQALFGRAPRAHQLLLPARCFGHGDGLSPALARRLPEAQGLIRGWIAAARGRQDGTHA